VPVRQTTNQTAHDSSSAWLKRIQSEYFEMPGLHLSKQQAQRFWNLDQHSCDVVFDALEASHFLKRTRANSYVRAYIDY